MPTESVKPVVMTIAGFDPSGGAGVLADIKTITAFGCYGVAAVTSLTLQSTRQVFGAFHQSAEAVRGQIVPLFDEFEVSAIKTGMLPTPEIIREIASLIEAKRVPLVVVDPVLKSTSGFELIDAGALEAQTRYLFPLSSVVTPNIAEAENITGMKIKDQPGMTRAAEAILKTGCRAVLITGGDADSESSTDLLLDGEGVRFYSTKRIRSAHTHGTGCTLASALASLLTTGHSLRDSVPIAKRYINEAIANASELGRGRGSLNHFPPGFDFEI